MTRLLTGSTGLLKKTAGLLGARTVGVLAIGLAALQEKQALPDRIRRKARQMGRKLGS
jgi:hypothetical protein